VRAPVGLFFWQCYVPIPFGKISFGFQSQSFLKRDLDSLTVERRQRKDLGLICHNDKLQKFANTKYSDINSSQTGISFIRPAIR
jgi:hypothetical protein